ncbi:TPA: phage protein NinX family protein [Yersinia enterocolitica]
MTDYSAMSDFEINKAVAESLGNHSVALPSDCLSGDSVECEITEAHGLSREGMLMARARRIRKDFCNNPADAWPIITGNRINVEWHEYKDDTFKPYALSNETMISCYADKPLRAAMIVYLMMKEKGDAKTSE